MFFLSLGLQSNLFSEEPVKIKRITGPIEFDGIQMSRFGKSWIFSPLPCINQIMDLSLLKKVM